MESSTATSPSLEVPDIDQKRATFSQQFRQQLVEKRASSAGSNAPSSPSSPTPSQIQAEFRQKIKERRRESAASAENKTPSPPSSPTSAQIQTEFRQKVQERQRENAASDTPSSPPPPTALQIQAEFRQKVDERRKENATGAENATPSPPPSLTPSQIRAEFSRKVSERHLEIASTPQTATPTAEEKRRLFQETVSQRQRLLRTSTSSPPRPRPSSPSSSTSTEHNRSRSAESDAEATRRRFIEEGSKLATTAATAAKKRPRIDHEELIQRARSRKLQAGVLADFEDEDCMDKGTLKSRAWRKEGGSCNAEPEITAEEKRYWEEYLGVYVEDEEKEILEREAWEIVPFVDRGSEGYEDFDEEEEEGYLEMGFETISCLGIL